MKFFDHWKIRLQYQNSVFNNTIWVTVRVWIVFLFDYQNEIMTHKFDQNKNTYLNQVVPCICTKYLLWFDFNCELLTTWNSSNFNKTENCFIYVREISKTEQSKCVSTSASWPAGRTRPSSSRASSTARRPWSWAGGPSSARASTRFRSWPSPRWPSSLNQEGSTRPTGYPFLSLV